MLKRRAKIRVKPVIAGISNEPAPPPVEETTGKNAQETAIETETQREEPKQQQQQQIEDVSMVDSQQRQQNQSGINLNDDDGISSSSEQDPLDSYIKFDDTFDAQSVQTGSNLNSTLDTSLNGTSEGDKHSCVTTSEDYVSVPIIFSREGDRPSSSQTFSPSLSSIRSEETEASTTQQSVRSSNGSIFDRKRAAERLAEKLVKKRVVERQTARLNGYLDEPVNSSQLCMRDLIYLNPRDNPMSTTSPTGRTVVREAVVSERPPPPANDDLPRPRLEIGPDGKIVINEASLVIHQKTTNFDDMMVVDDTNYVFDGYKSKKPRSKKWGMKETRRFYAALSMVGLDFSFISKLIPSRTRNEIKNKFKNEDKKNKALVDAALKVRKPLDISLLAEPPSDDDLVDEKPPKRKMPRAKKPRPAKPSTPKENTEPRVREKSQENSSRKSTRSKRKALFESTDDEVSSEGSEMAATIPHKRKIIEDDSSNERGENTVEKDPYDFDEETEDEARIEITRPIRRRRQDAKSSLRSKSLESLRHATPLQEATELSSSSLQLKLTQQLEQMEMDQQKSALKCDMDFPEISQDQLDPPENVNQPENSDPQEGSRKLFSELPISGKSHASINVIDHNSIDINELGIGEIPPNHKLVVVSVPFKDGQPKEINDPEQQLLQVFTISESALKTMMEDANNSAFDPVATLLAMAKEGISLGNEMQRQIMKRDAPKQSDETSRAGSPSLSDNDSNILDGLISNPNDFSRLMSPPTVQDEPFVEDVKIIPIIEGTDGLDADGRTNDAREKHPNEDS